MKPIQHDHPGESLTFGCPGCLDRVRRDQQAAAIAELPLRELTVRWRATAVHHGESVVEVNARADEDPAAVVERNWSEIEQGIAECVDFIDDYEIDVDDSELSSDELVPRPRPGQRDGLAI